jgi:hypothetical protein
MFSEIAAKLHGESNALYKLRDERKAQGHAVQDLVSGNINEQGFIFPQDLLEEILARGCRHSRIYNPDSFGQIRSREAVSEYYKAAGHILSPAQILITPGTSFSYWYCFKLLADPGDEILCPCPSYPLFDYIALMSGVKLVPYRMDERRDWAVDLEQLEACVSTRTRALVLISPHNPTGRVTTSKEIEALGEIALRHDLALISDEVFSDFLLGEKILPRPAGSGAPLVFTLNGFSKMFALPGLKFGWMAVSGESARVSRAMRAIELISDTFLPVNEMVQAAAPEIFRHGQRIKEDFAGRIRECWQLAETHFSPSRSLSYIKPDGGFYVSLRLENRDEEQVAEAILREHNALVHPGYFYDMAPHHLILSFVQRPEVIRGLFPKVVDTVERKIQA